MSRLDEKIIRQRSHLLCERRPLPLYYRFSRKGLLSMLPPGVLTVEKIDRSGRIFGIPFLLDESVPDDEVQFTTDFATWQVLR